MLFKIVLLGYSRGLISSRSIATACRHNVRFMAASGDSAPRFTTIAHFIGSPDDEARRLFAEVLPVCDRQGLIGCVRSATVEPVFRMPPADTAMAPD